MVDQNKMRDKAKEVLEGDDVRRLIGWKRGTYGFEAAPAVLKDASEVDQLIWDPTCVGNLAGFLTLEEKLPVPRGQEPDTRKVAVMVKGCDSRAVVQQLVEKAYDRDKVVVLGIPCTGVIDRRKAEALLAAGFIFTFHFFNTHFRIEKFPMDTVIFSGRISKTELLHERKRWYDRLVAENRLEAHRVKDEWEGRKKIAKSLGFLFFGTGLALLALIVYAMLSRLGH